MQASPTPFLCSSPWPRQPGRHRPEFTVNGSHFARVTALLCSIFVCRTLLFLSGCSVSQSLLSRFVQYMPCMAV